MGKRTVYTKITPLPNNIPRQLVLDMLHSHVEVIELNPLVTGVRSIEAPRDAAADEFFSQWYEISEVITWGFKFKKKIRFKGVFHDQPWGIQTHIYGPVGVDMRNKYFIGGNQPGEPRAAQEPGLEMPQDRLYLREDVEINCAVALTASFVENEHKASTVTMIDRLTKKAELLGEGKLHAILDQGRLKTAKLSTGPTFTQQLPSLRPSALLDPALPNESHATTSVTLVTTDETGFSQYHVVRSRELGQIQRYHDGSQQYHQYIPLSNSSLVTNTSGAGHNIYEVQASLHRNNVGGNAEVNHRLYREANNPAGLDFQQARLELCGEGIQLHEVNGDPRRSLYSFDDDPEKLNIVV